MTISIHNLDPDIERRIREEAEKTGKSLNQAVKDALREQYAQPEAPSVRDRDDDFLDLYGTWSEQEAEEFNRVIQDLFGRIDSETWS